MNRTVGTSLAVPQNTLRGSFRRGVAFGMLLLVTMASCATDPASDGVTAVQFQDVVVPTGLRLKDANHESYSKQEVDWRHGRFEYVGQTAVQAAADYVRERMPQHSWTKLKDETDDEAVVRIRFERGIYRADYTFNRSEGTTVMVVDYSTDYSRR
jgi:hypothetical protein